MAKLFKEDITSEQLHDLFQDEEKCYAFLAQLKWEGGYHCKKCGNDNYCAGPEPYSRRCTRCKSKETATNGTLFHGIKFPLHKAFFIAYQVCQGNTEISTYEFAKKLALRQMTCWKFKNKITMALTHLGDLTENERKSVQKMLGLK